MLYRVLKPLSFGDEVVRPGALHRLDSIPDKGRETLVRRGAVAEVAGPPLAILPGWKTRAARLAKVGIADAAAFLDADDDTIAACLGARGGTIAQWRREVEQWLTAPPPPRREG